MIFCQRLEEVAEVDSGLDSQRAVRAMPSLIQPSFAENCMPNFPKMSVR